MAGGASAMSPEGSSWTDDQWMGQFQMRDGDPVASLLAAYEQVAAATDELVRTLPDLDDEHALPVAPWSSRALAGRSVARCSTWSPRPRSAGHADILRESIDGAKTMG